MQTISKSIWAMARRASPVTVALALFSFMSLVGTPSPASAQGLFGRGGTGRVAAQPEVQVETQLISEVAAIEPGRPFRVGVLFEIIPGWHMYWREAGDVGLPTQIEWELPEGFEIGPLQWPNPERFYEPDGDLTSYAWDEEVLLFATVTPPSDLQPGAKVTIATKNEWLACEVQCIPGSSANSLTLPVGEARPSEHAALFGKYAPSVPVDVDAPDVPVEISVEPASAILPQNSTLEQRVTVRAEGPWVFLEQSGDKEARLFPDGNEDVETLHPDLIAKEDARQVAGAPAYEMLAFDWGLRAWSEARPGQYELTPALTLPAVNAETGETRTFYVTFDRDVRIAGEGGVAGLPGAGGEEVAAVDEQAPETEIAGAGGPPNGPGTDAAGGTGPPGFSFNVSRADQERSLPLFLLFAFLGGLILNVMPCVLPVLSIKVLGFVRQAQDDPSRIFRLGLVFAAGVFVSFFALASVIVAIKAGGTQVGWGFQLQEPRFVVIIAAVIFAFGLSLFGLFTVELPGAATQSLSGATYKEGASGAFFNGVLATVLATPCTAPLLGPALGFAFAQPWPFIYLFFFAIAAGLAMPYVLLAWRPGWLRFVPKPGLWMERFKQSMGVLLMATVVWLLWVLGKQAGADAIIAALWFLLAVGVACWAIGLGFDLARGTRRSRTIAGIVALALVIGGYWLFPERYLDALTQRAGAVPAIAQDPEATVKSAGGINWQPFSVERVYELAAEGRTVFVDFTADWCLTCKVNERTVLSTQAVAEAFEKHNVAPLLADYTRRQPEITAILQEFGRAGVPMYLVFPAGRPEDYILLPETLTVGIVIDALEKASNGVVVAEK